MRDQKTGYRPSENKRPKPRRRVDIEQLFAGREIVQAKVTDAEVSLFLDSHTVVKVSLRSTDEGPLGFSWNSLDTMKTEKDYWK